MKGAAALDIINHERKAEEPAAHLVSSPRARLSATSRQPEPHGPSMPEQELGEALHPDRNARHGHPGVDCHALPPGHAHRWVGGLLQGWQCVPRIC